ncbi:hypothetical protein LAC81_36985 (plasmid) [Ensifer adhaerens]|uniref:hypothetical protein n=1 Tax=Ensifer adhaerens TaxID=106592 RepID=UPI001CBCCB6B|nr:hypothetical protein [Ensifer adhaerens]MBZ7927535.1 hypothetical protein [Ensifer adhaerens]UAX97951.1 hypothetical protein LAC78_38290 [Ensifer adhaerens]UAY05330.1 hypothetical protein LAC80_37000 [Ensifer adhaerens]UAY12708.1 hypothetical protein LAC81_36985 [Ensifer adhaerens]
MKSTEDVIAELTRAALHVDALSEGEKLSVIARAYVTIQEGWEVLGQPERQIASLETMDVIRAGGVPVHLYDDEMRAILEEAIKVIQQIEAAMQAKKNATGASDP